MVDLTHAGKEVTEITVIAFYGAFNKTICIFFVCHSLQNKKLFT